jgi:tungsten cofactor oxidoreducase radical SAM maturase
VSLDAEGRLPLPSELRRRLGLEAGGELLVEETEASLVLHLLHPNVRKVYLEVTTRCNLHCRTCVRNIWAEPLEDMAPATFDRVVAQLHDLPLLREVVFGGYGEPFIHPRILDYLTAVKGLGLRVIVSTNGLLLDPERAETLVHLGVDVVSVSLDGVNPDTYADIRRGSDLLVVLHNIEVLNQVKSRLGSVFPRLEVEFVALKQNVAELPDLLKLAGRLGANRAIITHVLPHTLEMAADALYGREGTQQPLPVLCGWPVLSGDWLLWGTMELPRTNWGAERRCRFVTGDSLVIGWDGGVSPCYALSHSYPYYIFGRHKEVTRYTLGNVNQASLAEIWTTDEYVRFRAEVRRFHFPSCVTCDLRDTCDIAAANEGCWGWCPSCADCLWAQDIIRCP